MMKLDLIERRFVFKISRGLFLFIVGLISIGFVGALCLLLYTYSPTMKKSPPVKPEPPAVSKVSAEEVNKILMADKEKQTNVYPPPVEEELAPDVDVQETPTDPEMLKVRDLLEKIRIQFFPGEDSPWNAKFETVCTQRNFFYGNKCIGWGKRKVREGLKERLEAELKEWKNEERILFLESVLTVLQTLPKPEIETTPTPTPAPVPSSEGAVGEENPEAAAVAEPPKKPKENVHAIALYSLVDLTRAYRGVPKDVITQLAAMLGGSSKDKTPAAIPDDQKILVFKVMLSIKKRDSQTETLVAYLKAWNDLKPLFTDDNLNDGMVAVWNCIRTLFPDQVAPTIAGIREIINPIAVADRPKAVGVFDRLMKEKMSAAQSKYNVSMAEYQIALADIEADYTMRKAEKTVYRHPAFYGIGSTIAGIAFIGLILALLGIERNTRTLEELIKKMSEK